MYPPDQAHLPARIRLLQALDHTLTHTLAHQYPELPVSGRSIFQDFLDQHMAPVSTMWPTPCRYPIFKRLARS
jgi:hypothetical protein